MTPPGGKNDGKDYESLTEEVFRRLLAHGDTCADVVRDVIIQGKATAHQIDVCFTFHVANVEYKTIVQCKDWGSPVKQEQVLTFKSVLDDIPGQPRGIMVTRTGFQSGARDVAKHHGIKLYELRPPQDEDWDGLIRGVDIKGRFMFPEYRIDGIDVDEGWYHAELERLGIARTGETRTVALSERFSDATNNTIDIRCLLAPLGPKSECDWTAITYQAREPVLVDVHGLAVPRVRVSRIQASVRTHARDLDFSVRFDHLVAHCFHDVIEGKRDFLDAAGDPIGRSQVRDSKQSARQP